MEANSSMMALTTTYQKTPKVGMVSGSVIPLKKIPRVGIDQSNYDRRDQCGQGAIHVEAWHDARCDPNGECANHPVQQHSKHAAHFPNRD